MGCFAAAVVLFGSGAGSQQAEITAYYADHGDRLRQITGFYALAIAALFFVLFAGVLCRELDAPLVLATGTLTGTLLFFITFVVNLSADLVVRGVRRK